MKTSLQSKAIQKLFKELFFLDRLYFEISQRSKTDVSL